VSSSQPSQIDAARHPAALRFDVDIKGGELHRGDQRIAAPLALRRRNSSAETTTTSSRPCTVTCCGPSLRTRRTSSLKRPWRPEATSGPSEATRAADGFGASGWREGFFILVMLIEYHAGAPVSKAGIEGIAADGMRAEGRVSLLRGGRHAAQMIGDGKNILVAAPEIFTTNKCSSGLVGAMSRTWRAHARL